MIEKSIVLNGRPQQILGLSADDAYFASVADNAHWVLAELCSKLLKPNAICWDIGANIGIASHVIASGCPQGKVIAVEAGQQNFELLRTNIDKNGLSRRVFPVHAAAGGSDGRVAFLEASAYGHIASEGPSTRLISPQTLLDEFFVGSLDFVKIDIQGSEPAFIRAGMDLFRRYGTIIHLEFNAWCLLMNSRQDPVAFMDFIVQQFSGTYLIDRHSPALRRFDQSELRNVLHEIIVESNTVRHLLLTTEPDNLDRHAA